MGTEGDSFVLKWSDFHTSLAASFQEMRGDGDFLDATVAVDENHQLQAHKVVLSASSPYFKSMLKNNPAQHPVLVMPPEVNFIDLCSVFEFIYNGEVRVAAADLDSFMKLVSLLKVKGLTDSPPTGEEKKEPKKMKKARKPSFSSSQADAERTEDYYYNDPNQYEDGHKIHLKGLVCPMCKQMYQDVRSLKEHMYVNHNVDKDEPTQRSKANKKGQRLDDTEFVHCEFCDKQLKKKSLLAHKKRCHGLAGNTEEDPDVPMASTSRGPPKKGRKRKLEQPPAMDYYDQGDEYEQPLPQKAVAHVQPTTRPFKEDEHLPSQQAPPPPPPPAPPAPKMSPEKRRPPPGQPHPRQLQGQPRPKKPDLQSKLGLRFGDQISITASGDEGGYRRMVKRPPPPGMGQQPPQVPQVGPSPRPPQPKPRPKPENVRPQHVQPPPMPKEMAPVVKEEPEDYEDDEDLMGDEEEEEEEYYGDDPYYEDQDGMMEGSKPNLDGAYDEEEEEDDAEGLVTG